MQECSILALIRGKRGREKERGREGEKKGWGGDIEWDVMEVGKRG